MAVDQGFAKTDKTGQQEGRCRSRSESEVLMMKAVLAILFFASPVFAQDRATALAAAGCGPNEVQFDVKTDKNRHPGAQPESGRALVYVFNASSPVGSATTRIGLDGAWVGANRGESYFFFPVDPGDHRLCTNWQSSLKRFSKVGSAANLKAEAGKVYYFRTKIYFEEKSNRPTVKLELVDGAEGQFLVASSAFSTFHAKKPPVSDTDANPD